MANARVGSAVPACICAIVLVACGCGRSPLGPAKGAGGHTALGSGIGGNAGGQGSGGAGSGGQVSGGLRDGGRDGTGGAAGISGKGDAGMDAAELNSHGDCVIADTVSDTTTRSDCRPVYDDQLAMACGFGVRTGACGSYLIFTIPDSEASLRCFYDASTRRLVARHYCDDLDGEYCEGRASCTWQGPDVGTCYDQRSESLSTPICPRSDAGRD